jgi:hypothetical protein
MVKICPASFSVNAMEHQENGRFRCQGNKNELDTPTIAHKTATNGMTFVTHLKNNTE